MIVAKAFATSTRRFHPGREVTAAELLNELTQEQIDRLMELGHFERPEDNSAAAAASQPEPEQPATQA